MKAGMGKRKGSAFEREVCTSLSAWVSGGSTLDVYWRSSLSGGRSTVAFKKGVKLGNQVGDLSCIDPIGSHFLNAFAVECKHYADLNYVGLLTGKGKLLTFWSEISEQASRYNKHPFLVARQNRMKATVCLNRSGMYDLALQDKDTLLISMPHGMYIFDFEYFLKACRPYVAPNWRSSPNRQRKRLKPL